MPDSAATQRSPEAIALLEGRIRHSVWLRVLVVLAVAAIGVWVWRVSATEQYAGSFDTRYSLEQRMQLAQLAARIDPWDAEFARRATVMADWLKGSQAFDKQDYLAATLALADAYRNDVGDQELLALFQQAQLELKITTVYKAHVQHAHEGPQGQLRPQDLMP